MKRPLKLSNPYNLLLNLSKPRSGWGSILLTVAPLYPFLLSCARTEPSPILVSVGAGAIPVQIFQERWETSLRLGGEILEPKKHAIPELKKKLLQDLIEEELLIQEARRRGMNIQPEELEKKVQELKGSLPQRDFQRLLLEQYIDEVQWKEQLSRNLLIDKLIAAEAMRISDPTEQELRDLYQRTLEDWTLPARIHLHQILLKSFELAQNVYRELRQGKDFSILAQKYSRGAESTRGGDMGWVRLQDLPPQLQSAFDLPVNKPSQVISSPYGYHILLVTQRQPQRTLSFAEVYPLLRRRAQYEKLEKARNKLLQELHQTQPVTIHAQVWKQILAAP